VEGDICKEGLAMKAEMRKQIVEDVQVILNCAASVDFNEPLRDAIEINYNGSLRMQELALECKNLDVFTHVSTCYVNCDKKGFISEKIYQIDRDSEELIKKILQMTPQQIVSKTKEILGAFPNTYTFTKSMAERTLAKRRGNLPMVILRPSIIGCCLSEPFIGWIDSLGASGGLTFAGGMGIVKFIYGKVSSIADLVPCDLVVNAIIVSAVQGAKKDDLQLVNCGTSNLNPLTWNMYMKYCLEYVKHQPFAN